MKLLGILGFTLMLSLNSIPMVYKEPKEVKCYINKWYH